MNAEQGGAIDAAQAQPESAAETQEGTVVVATEDAPGDGAQADAIDAIFDGEPPAPASAGEPQPEPAPEPEPAQTAAVVTPLLSDEGHAVAAAAPAPHEREHKPLVDLHELEEDVGALEAEAAALWRCAVTKIMALPHFAQGELGRVQAFIRDHL